LEFRLLCKQLSFELNKGTFSRQPLLGWLSTPQRKFVPQLLGWVPPIGNTVAAGRKFVTNHKFTASRNIGFVSCTNRMTTDVDLEPAGGPSSINFGHKLL
jgi:hypothetical protein